MNRELTEAGRWFEQLGEALTVGMDGFRELSQGVQALVANPVTRERAAAATPGLRRLIERSRGDIRRSNGILDALPPYPPEMVTDIPPQQLVADARAYNARMLALLEAYDDFVIALGKADMAGMERAMPRLREGAFAMVGQHRLLLRNRQASVPATESTYQSLGVAGQLYRAMEAVFRHSMVAREGSEAATAAASLRDELGLVADDTRALAAAGRRNVERELSEIDASRGSDDASEARLVERVRGVFAAEAKVFALADRLVAFAEANKGVTAAQLRAPGGSRLLPALTQLEADYIAITLEQAAALAEGRE